MKVTISLTRRKDLEKIMKTVKESLEETQGRKHYCRIIVTFDLPNCKGVEILKS